MSTRDLSRYQNAQIYSIRSHMTPEVYYGSSCKMLAKRLHEHRNNFKNYNKGNYKRYVSSYEILKYPDNYIELEAKVPCTCIQELRAIEGQYIRNNPCVNKNVPGRSSKQWWEDNKETLRIKKKEYYEDNKERILAYDKEYREKNKKKISEKRNQKITCECGSVTVKRNYKKHLTSKKHKNWIKNN